MNARVTGLALVLAVGAFGWACGTNNPTRPSVSFVAPTAQGPANGIAYNFNQQPITLQIANSARTGTATVTYNLEVATTPAFTTLAVSREAVAEGSGGTTSVQLPQLNGNTTYYWRWSAVVDSVVGSPSVAQSFFLRPNVTIGVPTVQSPRAGDAVFTARPTFTVTNAAVTGPAGTVQYDFQVSTSAAFGTLTASQTVTQGSGGVTSWTPSADLPQGTLFWRVRAKDVGSDVTGAFTSAVQFDRRFGIDLATVRYIQGPDISTWPQTATLTDAYKSGDVVCTEFTTTLRWPDAPFLGDPSVAVFANQWVFALVGGVWYGGAGHWLRPNQFCKTEYDELFFVDAFRNPPFNSLVLHSGDVFGVAVSTPARFYPADKTLDHRSDVRLIVW